MPAYGYDVLHTYIFFFFFSSRRRHTRFDCDWSSDVCSSDLWDEPDDVAALRALAAELGLGFDAVNSNTFQDQPGQPLSYKLGSFSHPDAAVRRQAVERSEEHTSELQSQSNLVCRLLLEKKKK